MWIAGHHVERVLRWCFQSWCRAQRHGVVFQPTATTRGPNFFSASVRAYDRMACAIVQGIEYSSFLGGPCEVQVATAQEESQIDLAYSLAFRAGCCQQRRFDCVVQPSQTTVHVAMESPPHSGVPMHPP